MNFKMQNPEKRRQNIYLSCNQSLVGTLERISKTRDPSIRRALIGEFFSWIFHDIGKQEVIAASAEDLKTIINQNKSNELDNS